MKNKNLIIGGLLALVVIMAVGYAAFATTLNISSDAKISSTWDVHFDTTNNVINCTNGFNDATTCGTSSTATSGNPYGNVTYPSNTSAEVTTRLYQPGDIVVYTLKIVNNGTIAASLSDPSLIVNTENDAIKYDVSDLDKTNWSANGGYATLTLTVTYNSNVTSQPTSTEGKATISITATQA